jgi:hypothetical protein
MNTGRLMTTIGSGILLLLCFDVVAFGANDVTTTTTIPISPSGYTADSARSVSIAPGDTAGGKSNPLDISGSCSLRFRLEPRGDWVDLRFTAAYDRHAGSIASSEGTLECRSSGTFETMHAENHFGVLQIALANHKNFNAVSGPAELAECEYQYRNAAPAPDDFVVQVQSADTIIPLRSPGGPPVVSLVLQCSEE